MNHKSYTTDELMVCLMSREMKDGELVVQGVSTPLVFTAFILAKRTHAPHLYFMYLVGNTLADVPGQTSISVIEKLTLTRYLKRITLAEINELAHYFRPREFMRPAQVDGRGNFNNTVIGNYKQPKVRLPGGVGIPDATNFNDHLNLYVLNHTPRILVNKVNFITGLGYGEAMTGRKIWPVVSQGPNLILTELCIFDFEDGFARLSSLHLGVTMEEVKRQTGFSFQIASRVKITEPPSSEELRLIREEVDPLGVRRLEFLQGSERLVAIKKILDYEAEMFKLSEKDSDQ